MEFMIARQEMQKEISILLDINIFNSSFQNMNKNLPEVTSSCLIW